MAHLQFSVVQDRPTEFLDVTSLTLDEFRQLIPPFEAVFQAHVAAVLSNVTDSRPAHWGRTGQWRLPAYGDLPISLGPRCWCPYPKC